MTAPSKPGLARGSTASRPSSFAPWVPAFLSAAYFQPCDRHRHHKKNECTFFCVTCGARPHSVCQHCMGAHAGHQVIQVRRYVYCDVVRAVDINPFVDTNGVQNYIINSAKVMFLNHRPHSKIGRANGVDTCRTCNRHLREGFSYCSLSCKVEALSKGETGAPAPAPTAGLTPSPSAGPCRACSSPAAALEAACEAAAATAAAVTTLGRTGSSTLVPAAPAADGTSAEALAAPSPRRSGAFAPFAASAFAPAASAAAAVSGTAAAAAGQSSDPDSSDEPCEEAFREANSPSRAVPHAPTPRLGRRQRGGLAYGSVSYGGYGSGNGSGSGSGSSEEDEYEVNFENPPKRRRSVPNVRRLSSANGYLASGAGAEAGAGDECLTAVAAAEALLMPQRNGAAFVRPAPLAGGLRRCETMPVPAAAPEVPSAAAMALAAAGSRRKKTPPQRAPSV
ncbi:hypothetical protein HYH03_014631 [Edaphochlamys debaryana]|uniref:Uncharacterized protein n=1 Tax=Edaphochlamys debaryana TaxID=47281 RepID=A0A836BS22_9CHLO|nr:hypothetical protein HYH03_014631 [Edaphochlamys debaryana]|eukprot:KAG2486702.1 hypothetical protein HYH03_014631 [Edaphochlamys debaryana]